MAQSDPPKHSMRVHTEFHRLVTELEDAHARMYAVPVGSQDTLDAYADLAQRRKELYGWVMESLPPFPAVCAFNMRF